MNQAEESRYGCNIDDHDEAKDNDVEKENENETENEDKAEDDDDDDMTMMMMRRLQQDGVKLGGVARLPGCHNGADASGCNMRLSCDRRQEHNIHYSDDDDDDDDRNSGDFRGETRRDEFPPSATLTIVNPIGRLGDCWRDVRGGIGGGLGEPTVGC
ncbi:hypothetical protein ACLKA6_018044 [Drosophila palustris]